MALTVENANKVWEKAKAALAGASPVAQAQFKALKLWLATQKNIQELAILPFVSTSVDDATGQVLVDAACTVYGMYSKKLNTATDVYIELFDDATDDAGAGTDGRVVLPHLVGNDECVFVSPQGLPMAAGVVAKAYTDFDGTTDSSSADCPNGFVIVGR